MGLAAARNVSTEDAPLDGDGDDAAVRNWYPDPSELEVVEVVVEVVLEVVVEENEDEDAPLAAKPREALSGAAFAVEPSPGLRDDDDEEEDDVVGLET